MTNNVIPFLQEKAVAEVAAIPIRRSGILLQMGSRRYQIEFTASAKPMPPHRALRQKAGSRHGSAETLNDW